MSNIVLVHSSMSGSRLQHYLLIYPPLHIFGIIDQKSGGSSSTDLYLGHILMLGHAYLFLYQPHDIFLQ